MKTPPPKNRNPIARVITTIRPQTVGDKRIQVREEEIDNEILDAIVEGLYDRTK